MSDPRIEKFNLNLPQLGGNFAASVSGKFIPKVSGTMAQQSIGMHFYLRPTATPGTAAWPVLRQNAPFDAAISIGTASGLRGNDLKIRFKIGTIDLKSVSGYEIHISLLNPQGAALLPVSSAGGAAAAIVLKGDITGMYVDHSAIISIT